MSKILTELKEIPGKKKQNMRAVSTEKAGSSYEGKRSLILVYKSC